MPPAKGVRPNRLREPHRAGRKRGGFPRGVASCLPLAAVAIYAAFVLWRLAGIRNDDAPAGTALGAADDWTADPLPSDGAGGRGGHEVSGSLAVEDSRAHTAREDQPLSQRAESEEIPAADVRGNSVESSAEQLHQPRCRDTNDSCETWAAAGECLRNPKFMAHGCKGSCGLCTLVEPQEIVQLVDGRVLMPSVGFGTAGLGAATREAVGWAWEAGYRHFDSAQAREWYREDLVGQALEGILKTRRGEVFLTSKLHPRHLGYHTTMAQVQTSLVDLHTSYLDLFMLHFRECWGDLCGNTKPEGTWRESWKALEELWHAGTVRLLGVSNFNEDNLLELLAVADVKPHVVEANSDPFNANTGLQEICQLHGIKFIGYSTLGSQWMMRGYDQNPVLSSPVIKRIAATHEVSEAQVVLRWALQKGQIVIPRSSKQAHIGQNRDLWGFSLSEDNMAEIDDMEGTLPRK